MALWRWAGRVAYWVAWPALFVYLRLGARTRVLVVAEDHVLLVLSWMSDARWSLPGGGLHRHEQLADGAIREVAEETGVMLQASQLNPLGSEWRSAGGLKYYAHFLTAQLDKRVAVREQRVEIIEVRWVPLSEVKTLPRKHEVDRALELLAATR